MTRVDVAVETDHLEKLMKPTRPIAGIGELVWNALDAEASEVEIRVDATPIGGIEKVEVVDDGHGMTRESALEEFGKLGGSWKREKRTSKNGKRKVHGSEGEGRWRAFSVGDLVRWVTVAEVDGGGRERFTIIGQRSAPKHFELGESEPTEDPVGTTVIVENIRPEILSTLLGQDAVDELSADFALFLEMYPDAHVRFRADQVDPAKVTRHRATYSVEVVGEKGDAEVTVIEWAKKDVRRVMLLCDSSGVPLGEIPPGIQAAQFEFTSYLRWDGFRDFTGDLAAAELHPDLMPVIEGAKEQLRSHFKNRSVEVTAEVLEEWKSAEVYPYEGPPTSNVERAEREIFDIVAVTASRAVNATAEKASRKLSLRLLRQALERDPGSLRRVLGEVLGLSKARLEELDRLLERTSLSAIIAAARVVADRLDFLSALQEILFEPEAKGALLERQQLHKMLAQESWVFGDEWALAANDESLTTLLKGHLHLLGREELAPNDPEVLREDGRRGIVDMGLVKSIPMSVQQHEYLVVELKRPTKVLDAEDLSQLESYAAAIADDERFAGTNTNWTFLLLGNQIDSAVTRRARQANRPEGLVSDTENQRVWVKTWSQILDDCAHRLKFIRDNLDLDVSRDHAVEYLRQTYAQFVPATVLGTQDDPIAVEVAPADAA